MRSCWGRKTPWMAATRPMLQRRLCRLLVLLLLAMLLEQQEQQEPVATIEPRWQSPRTGTRSLSGIEAQKILPGRG